jgi:hypothetical protein
LYITGEKIMEKISNIPKEEHTKTIEANKKLCICPECPTYNDCAKEQDELLFCILGKSETCITKESGCICPACPITEKLGLTKQYYCTKGTEQEQKEI